jgi:hypothetical protein
MTTSGKTIILLLFHAVSSLIATDLSGQYTAVQHRNPAPGEIPVTAPGCYAEPGTTYILMNDISAPASAIFLGKDVTLDLNGYTITFADGAYEQIPNGNFEEGMKDWDLSKAPSARIEDTKVHVFIGNYILRLKAGEEITSSFINLPVALRSYFAFCGVISLNMRISVFVEDSEGKIVECVTEYGDTTRVSCPILNRSPRLGGGFVYAHLNGLPAGKYRIRIKAETDCLIDYAGIRPSMDVGVGIVESTHPMGYYDHLYNSVHSAFFDYTASVKLQEPLPGIPRVTGKGSVTIRNGSIRNANQGILSWGIQSTADKVLIVLDNMNIRNSGINSTAVDVPQATITHCSFDADNPFIINRHGSEFYAVDLTGSSSSEVSYSEFHGGQGCLSFKGNYSKIHHNFFANRQTVTNHYSVMAMGDSSAIFENRIIPEIGSGLEIYVHRGMEVFNNDIQITAAPPTCEYRHEEYSTTAIRIADYNAKPGSPDGCFGNKIYNNKIVVTGKDYPDYADYIPMAWAVFYSASGGENYIFGNDITVNDINPGLKNDAAAFYIGGGAIGGQFFNNRITANVPAVWVASRYGGAKDTRIFHNYILKTANRAENFSPVRMGWMGWAGCIAENIRFESNTIEGASFGVDATDQPHSYSVYWKLTVKVTDKKGLTLKDREVRILDKEGREVETAKTSLDGTVQLLLPEYTYSEHLKKISSPYLVYSGKMKQEVVLDRDAEIILSGR